MKIRKYDVLIIVLSLAALVFFLMPEAKCAWCPSYKCYGEYSCGHGCRCLTMGGDLGGRCFSVERGR